MDVGSDDCRHVELDCCREELENTQQDGGCFRVKVLEEPRGEAEEGKNGAVAEIAQLDVSHD